MPRDAMGSVPCPPSTTQAVLIKGGQSWVVLWLDFCPQTKSLVNPKKEDNPEECMSHTSEARPHAEIMVVYPQKLL